MNKKTVKEKIICNRCGGERKISKRWYEGEGSNKFEVMETVCLNKECQETLDRETAESMERREFLASQRNQFQKQREKERLDRKKKKMEEIG